MATDTGAQNPLVDWYWAVHSSFSVSPQTVRAGAGSMAAGSITAESAGSTGTTGVSSRGTTTGAWIGLWIGFWEASGAAHGVASSTGAISGGSGEGDWSCGTVGSAAAGAAHGVAASGSASGRTASGAGAAGSAPPGAVTATTSLEDGSNWISVPSARATYS